MNRFLVINAGVGGATYGNFTTPATNRRFTRFDLATTVPDIAVFSSGINEANAGTSAEAFSEGLGNAIKATEEIGVKRRYVTTVMSQPNSTYKAGTITKGIASGVTKIETSNSYALGDEISIDTGLSTAETVKAKGASTGNGPFETELEAATTKAHKVGANVGIKGEKLRQEYNVLIRRGIRNVDGIFDFAAAILPDEAPNWWRTCTIHPGTNAYMRFASLVRVQ